MSDRKEKRDKMISVRFSGGEVEALRKHGDVSDFIRRAVKAALPKPSRPLLAIDSYFVPYGYGGMNGHNHVCKTCGMRTGGPSYPMYTGHFGDCAEFTKIANYFESVSE